MADAKKCDRCGNIYEETQPTAFESLADALSEIVMPQRVTAQASLIEYFLDLCPLCCKSLKRWVKGDRVEDGKT